ncbi:peptide/nickel transport system permease protein [Pseudonocardia sediminis]|uniref:Peptide/nickel transport system permease protein n=1 Tax=Pseudonocardia sediminis TaxID=1397368 RepID=A0A4Q7V3Z1_PSEST|nr:ABC transporter permease [Pseudonocardia sediminis]RZT89116.1 peptide/nickel transport system permease protein [Pseudonocardia sediminis]
MSAVLARRLLALPVVLFLASVLIFLLPRMAGVDTARAILRSRLGEAEPDPAVLAAIRLEFGLDASLTTQYWRWLSHVVVGDLGNSFTTRTSVAGLLFPALGVSLVLTAAALVLAALAGIPAGVWSARRPGGRLDRAVTATSVLGVATPEFVLGTVLVLVFAVALPVLPATGWGSVAQAVLPVLTLAAFPAALAAQLTRAETVDALARPHVMVARSKGIEERAVLWRHGGRLALTSVTSLSGLFFGGLLGGAVVVEVVFAVPGLGGLLYDSVVGQDLPVVQSGLLAVVAVAALASIAAEGLQLALDPVGRSTAT